MLKQIKANNEKILKKHFEEVFGENYTIDVKWGFPVIVMNINLKNGEENSLFTLGFNSETKDYELSVFSYKIVEEKQVPTTATITKQIIDFIIDRTELVTEQFFTTKDYKDPQEETTPPEPETTPPQFEEGQAEIIEEAEEEILDAETAE